jgi:phosphoglucomutase
MDSHIVESAQNWATNKYFDEPDRKEIQNLLETNNEKELIERFHKNLAFGTGGLREIMGVGRNRINKYTIRKATQALANCILTSFPDASSHLVCVAYDSRHNSEKFAKEVCQVMAANNIKTKIFSELKPVPLLSYSVKHLNAHAGVMITASHNPKEYNGYKVYWQHGGQVTPPQDQMIIDEYNNISSFDQTKSTNYEDAKANGLIKTMEPEVEQSYYDFIKSTSLNLDLCLNQGSSLKIIYTPLHGTGAVPIPKMLKTMGFTNLSIVKEQQVPDGDFPTTKSPNPESPEALALAVKLMNEEQGDLAFGTDPDTDRIGVAVRSANGPVYLTGNQMGTLLLYYVLENRKRQNLLPADSLVLKTIVTSYLQDEIAKSYNVKVFNTLTGFKWMAAHMVDLEKKREAFTFIFGNEESFGYLSHEKCRDKDGISAAALFCEMTLWFKQQNLNLLQALDYIYEKFGFSYEKNLSINYLGVEGSENIKNIMKGLRQDINSHFADYKLSAIEDYQTQKKTILSSQSEEKINLPQSNVLGFILEDGDRVYARPSGTEPKIKFYILLQEKAGSLDEKKKKTEKKAEQIEAFIRNYCEQSTK